VNVSGWWSVAVESDLGSGTATFVFKQAKGTLTGEYEGLFGHLPVTGTINGNEIAFSFFVEEQNATIAYKGTAQQDSMTGKVDLGGQGSGTFDGKRMEQN
jgi:hypothetical protein